MKRLTLLITVAILTLTIELQGVIQNNKTYISNYDSDTLYCFEGRVVKAIEIDLINYDYADSILFNINKKNEFLDSIIKNKDAQIKEQEIMFNNCISITRADSIQAKVLSNEIKRLNKREKRIKIVSGIIFVLSVIFL